MEKRLFNKYKMENLNAFSISTKCLFDLIAILHVAKRLNEEWDVNELRLTGAQSHGHFLNVRREVAI